MRKIRYILPLTLFLLSGCLNTQQVERMFLPRISEEEAFAAANEYLAKQKNQPSASDNELELWVQPANKSVPCKLCVVTNKNDDITKTIGYRIYWDGECKNGYAYGLGREFEKSATRHEEYVSLYTGNKERMTTFSRKNILENGYRQYIFKDKNSNKIYMNGVVESDINIFEFNRCIDKEGDTVLTVYKELTNGMFIIDKNYREGFYYRLVVFPANPKKISRSFEINDTATNANIGFVSYQFASIENEWKHFKIKNGRRDKEVKMPESYIKLIDELAIEANSVLNNSSTAKQVSQNIVESYKQMVKSGEVKNNFMNKKDYMAIFEEEKKMLQLNKKIIEKINTITDANERERLIRAREQEALAAQRQAEAAGSAAIGAMLHNSALQETNQQLQNLNQQFQYMRMGL